MDYKRLPWITIDFRWITLNHVDYKQLLYITWDYPGFQVDCSKFYGLQRGLQVDHSILQL